MTTLPLAIEAGDAVIIGVTGHVHWTVEHVIELPTGSKYAILKSPFSGRTRTEFLDNLRLHSKGRFA